MTHLRMIAFACVIVGAGAAQASLFSDDFNRADLGSDWTVQNPTIGITGNEVVNGNSSNGIATVTGFSAQYESIRVSADVKMNGSGGYGALVLGYDGNGQGDAIFVKVQSNSGTSFDRFGFYTGNNISSGGIFANLDSTFVTARISVYAVGNTAFLDIDTDNDTVADQSYSHTFSSLTLGDGVGMGVWESGSLDNYSVDAVPEPAMMTLLGLGALAAMRKRRRA